MKYRKMKCKNALVTTIIFILLLTFGITQGVNAKQKDQMTKAYVKVQSKLNLREGPSTNTNIIGKLLPGEIVFVTDKEISEDWTKIVTQTGEEGYVSTQYLALPKMNQKDFEMLSVAVITKTDGSSENRNFNMAKAADAINGLLLLPGDKFAWYDTEDTLGTVGRANEENGYKMSTVISGGKYVKDYGGGVCQVSTALYNCINKLGIIPTEHHHHSLKSSYVEAGMDATVNYPNLNFTFTNTLEYSLIFEAYADGPQVVIIAYREK